MNANQTKRKKPSRNYAFNFISISSEQRPLSKLVKDVVVPGWLKQRRRFRAWCVSCNSTCQASVRVLTRNNLLKAVELRRYDISCAAYIISNVAEDVNATQQNGLVGDSPLVHAIAGESGPDLAAKLMNLVHAVQYVLIWSYSEASTHKIM